MKLKELKIRTLLFELTLLICGVTTFTFGIKADSYYDRKVSLFELLPINSDDIVFLGNSITDGGEFQELLGMHNVKNRGISSDVISGVEKRIAQVMLGKPKKIFLLIGINDVSHNLTVSQLASKYEKLVKNIRMLSPSTEVYLQSVMPINNDFKRYKSLYGKEKTIVNFNKEIEKIAKNNGCTFIDLTPALADPSTGKLKKAYTNDGLHLTGAGYKAWMKVVKPYVEE